MSLLLCSLFQIVFMPFKYFVIDAHFMAERDFMQNSADFLSQIIPKWQKYVKEGLYPPGSPLMLVICGAALRAAQLNR